MSDRNLALLRVSQESRPLLRCSGFERPSRRTDGAHRQGKALFSLAFIYPVLLIVLVAI